MSAGHDVLSMSGGHARRDRLRAGRACDRWYSTLLLFDNPAAKRDREVVGHVHCFRGFAREDPVSRRTGVDTIERDEGAVRLVRRQKCRCAEGGLEMALSVEWIEIEKGEAVLPCDVPDVRVHFG